MPKLLGISLSLGFLISLVFLFGFSWYAISLRAQLTECSSAAAHAHDDQAAFHLEWIGGIKNKTFSHLAPRESLSRSVQ